MRTTFTTTSSLASLFLVSLAFPACRRNDDEGSLESTEQALVTDNADSQEGEDALEDGIENGLGGATVADTGEAVEATDLAGVDAKIATNPGLYFSPAGCLVSTRLEAGKWSHAFTNCKGPAGKVTYTGTIISTWAVAEGKLSVKHEANSFIAKGDRVTATISGAREVTYTRSGTLLTKTRKGSWGGTLTKNADATANVAWSHEASFVSTWDSASRCYTRDGSAENTVGTREFGRTVSGFKICGGIFACPSSGEFEVTRKNGAASITVTFLGGAEAEVTGARGRTARVALFCSAQ